MNHSLALFFVQVLGVMFVAGAIGSFFVIVLSLIDNLGTIFRPESAPASVDGAGPPA